MTNHRGMDDGAYRKELLEEIEELSQIELLRDTMPSVSHFQLQIKDDDICFTFLAPRICETFGCSENDEVLAAKMRELISKQT